MELGWAGVNLFFVISGVLITGILLDSKNDQHYFRNFYMRRVLRIFPIYYLTLAIMFLPFFNHEVIGYGDSPYYIFYAQNIVQGQKNFLVNFTNAFDHTWSLAVEEQFYLFWPFLVYKLDRRKLAILIPFLFFMAFVWRVFVLLKHGSAGLLYTLLPMQIDSLMAGAFLALLFRSKPVSTDKMARTGISLAFLANLGLFALIFYYGYDVYGRFSWTVLPFNTIFLSLLSVVFAGWIVFILNRQTIISKSLCLPVLRYVGKISYGLYLYHYPVLFTLSMISAKMKAQGLTFHPVIFILLNLCITFMLAAISWRFIEAPILSLKDRFASRPLLTTYPSTESGER